MEELKPTDLDFGDERYLEGMGPESSEHYDTLVIGGGLTGTAMAAELSYNGHDFAVADPEGYGSNFFDYARGIGQNEMRSGFDAHIDPYGLAPLLGEGERPSLDDFEQHVEDVVQAYALEDYLQTGEVEEISRDGDVYSTIIDGKEVTAENIVLANGKGPLNTPDYDSALPDEAPAYHSMADFSVEEAAQYDGQTLVIGGGISSAQIGKELSGYGADAKLVSRSGIEYSDEEADEEWKDWDFVKENLEGSPEEIHEQNKKERYDGTVPEYLQEDLEKSSTDIIEGVEIEEASYNGHGIDVVLSNGESYDDVQLVYATGFEDAYQDPLYQKMASDLDMATGFGEMPVLGDNSLEWLDENGKGSNIYLTGEKAEGTLGPFAPNIVMANTSAELIENSISEDLGIGLEVEPYAVANYQNAAGV